MGMVLGSGFSAWPDTAQMLTEEQVITMYHEGFAGAFQDPEASDQLDDEIRARGGIVEGEDVAMQYGFADQGVGKLVIHYPSVVKYYSLRALTRPGQKTGDCVSKAGRDCSLFLICLEADAGLPDEVSGLIEAPPVVSELALRNGVFINEGIYLHRGHNRQGMACSQGVRWISGVGGVAVRQKFPQVDLESYNVQFELRGSGGSPQWLNELARKHVIRDVTRPRGWEAARDFVSRGKPLWVCSGLGFSKVRDANGFSKRSGSWAHSWHVVGFDDREVTRRKYGFPLALVGHRWAAWNTGGREILESAGMVPIELREAWQAAGLLAPSGNILIPEGYWWIDARLLNSCELYATSGATGWAVSSLPDYLGGW